MKHSAQGPSSESQESNPAEPIQPRQLESAYQVLPEHKHPSPTKLDMLGKGVVTGVAVSVIVQTGRSVGGKLLKNPVFLFGMGLTAGFFLRKYRKEIMSTAGSAAVHGRDFVVRQKEKIKEILADDIDAAD